MIPITTKRLVIRNFTAADGEALHKMIAQYQASEFAAYDQQWPTSAEEIKSVAEWFAGGDHFLAVCLNDSSRFIGFVALNPEEEGVYNLGYVFDSNYHGRGYAAEACRAVLDRAFGSLNASRVVTGTAAVNKSSCRLLERLGFRKTGEAVSSFKTGEDGKPVEFLGYSYVLTNDDWGA
jgi:ribosomal-protein-alanine N-acetyltransferase